MTAKPKTLYLEKRSDTYFFRRRLPANKKNLQKQSPRFLCFSIRTQILFNANILVRRLTMLTDRAFAWNAEFGMLSQAQLKKFLEELVRFEIDAHHALRAAAPERSREAAHVAYEREIALQDVLRDALLRGDRDVARKPLRAVAARLNIAMSEDDPTWPKLAYEATRVLLDISRERANRELGQYSEPSPYYQSARAELAMARPIIADLHGPDSICQTMSAAVVAEAQTSSSTVDECLAAPTTASRVNPNKPAQMHHTDSDFTPVYVPELDEITPDPVAGYDEEERMRIKMRPPLLNFDPLILSEELRTKIKTTPRGITIEDGIQLYAALKKAGYDTENMGQPQRRNHDIGTHWWKKNQRDFELAARIWLDLLSNEAFESVDVAMIEDALQIIGKIPANHGRSENYTAYKGYRELVERMDEWELTREHENLKRIEEHASDECPITPAEREQAVQDAKVLRLSASTFIKHGRFLNKIGKMLHDMQLIDRNPFSICVWTAEEEKKLRLMKGFRPRIVWDDRIQDLFQSSAFQGDVEDPGEPLFWVPLIGRFMGTRSEEVLQLKPRDFGTEEGIPYLEIHTEGANSVKSDSGVRRLPIHPELIRLGLMKLVDLRRKQGLPRLFPHIERGKHRQTFTANFTKRFGYYRKTTGCYVTGMDLHALRTTFCGDLMNTGCPDSLRRRLMGHEPLDEGERSYSQGLKMSRLLEELRKVQVDTSLIVSPFEVNNAHVSAEKGFKLVQGGRR